MKRTIKIDISEEEIRKAVVDYLHDNYNNDKRFNYNDIKDVVERDVLLPGQAIVDGENTTIHVTAQIEIVTDF